MHSLTETPVLDALKTNPWVIYVAMIGGALVWLSTVSESVQKLLGPLGRALAARQARREARILSLTDVRILDYVGQVEHLARRVDTLERELYPLQQNVAAHRPWDWRILELARRIDPQFPDPPPFYPVPPEPPAQQARS